MGYRLEFDAAHRVTLLSFQNHVSEATLGAGDRALRAFVGLNMVVGAIFDFSGVETADVSAVFIRELANATVALPGKPRVMVASRGAIFGFSRMFQIIRELKGDDCIELAKSMNEALRMLKMESVEFEPIAGESDAPKPNNRSVSSLAE